MRYTTPLKKRSNFFVCFIHCKISNSLNNLLLFTLVYISKRGVVNFVPGNRLNPDNVPIRGEHCSRQSVVKFIINFFSKKSLTSNIVKKFLF